ncbi:MAG: alpha/beta fold hydrolase [Gammaproteobacteria bacterium]
MSAPISASSFDFHDHWYEGSDGLRLYARDYPHAAPRATVLCMHGLTRNSADFAELCTALSADYRVIAVDQRGRGRSAYADPATYNPLVYVQDMFRLLDGLDLARVALVGTSMGGLMSLVMASLQPQRFTGVVLNDIGPVIDPVGLDRIRRYVGRIPPVNSWEDAVAQVKAINAPVFPDWTADDWTRFTHKLYRDEGGRPVLAHDPAIAESIRATPETPPIDLWPAFAALAKIPTLVIRGETSDILARDCVDEMKRRKPDLVAVEVPRRGHAPMLDEPVARAAIVRFLAGLPSA